MKRGDNLRKQGMSGTPEHRAWCGMMTRCYWAKPCDRNYALYRGSGIIVVERWHDFINFLSDMVGQGRKMEHSKPLMIELFSGLHGWGEGAVAEGYRCVGFDIVDMCKEIGHPKPEGCQLVLQDVTTIHGSQFKDAALIVASPPCQAYSYRAMPWKRAKALPPPDNTLFDACFRIQSEASEAAGRHIPMVVENVRGAQKWVGRARWNFGSFYLWGDVPALMPAGRVQKTTGHPNKRDGHGHTRHLTNPGEHGIKQPGIGGVRENGKGDAWFQDGAARYGSKSPARKAASAMIAKIPLTLSRHIARCWKPNGECVTTSLPEKSAPENPHDNATLRRCPVLIPDGRKK